MKFQVWVCRSSWITTCAGLSRGPSRSREMHAPAALHRRGAKSIECPQAHGIFDTVILELEQGKSKHDSTHVIMPLPFRLYPLLWSRGRRVGSTEGCLSINFNLTVDNLHSGEYVHPRRIRRYLRCRAPRP